MSRIRPLVSPDHRSERAAHHPVDPAQVGVQDVVPVLLFHPQQEGVADDPGVRYDHLYAAEFGLDGVEGLVDLSASTSRRTGPQKIPSGGADSLYVMATL